NLIIMPLAGVMLTTCICSRVSAQDYPARPLRLIVPWPPGGGADVIARVIFQKVGEQIGQQVIVDNRGGASTIIGMDIVAKAAPDGYTFGFPTSNLTVNPALFSKLPFDVARDLAPVTQAVNGLYILAVHPALSAKSVGELIALAKAAPGRLNASIAGAGTPTHLGLEQFKAMAGVSIAAINYKGAAPAATGLLSGETQLMFVSAPTVLTQVQAGKLRAIAVMGATRSSALPELPTVAESGLDGYAVSEWYGVVAPSGTSAAQIGRINGEIRKVLALPEVKDRLVVLGAEVVASTPPEFGAFIKSDIAKWGKLVREAGIKAE
ncbi:MAG TPA: tripartite tricarboxylate transporter substrate binding protein, partial [Burkholderiales bacterium]|nr:tripartite tricarboxylate transporter substrate binding protein [Burkholderiales bacterium]